MTRPRRTAAGPVPSAAAHSAILDAARDILTEERLAGLSLNHLARRAGASKPTIYRHWPNKAALILELYRRERTAALDVPPQGDVRADLVALIAATWRFWAGTPAGEALRGAIAEAQSDPEALTLIRDDWLASWRAYPQAILDRARAAGELPEGYDTATAVTLLTGFNWLHLLSGQLDRTDAIAPTVDMILLRAPSPVG